MKVWVLFFVLFLIPRHLNAGGPYRKFLLSEIYPETGFAIKPHNEAMINYMPGPAAFIPHFERPKGAIFCRMEDKVTKATKVWLKIGVQ